MSYLDPSQCPLCDQANHCQLCHANPCPESCWCTKVTIPESLLARVPDEGRNIACICQNCVRAFSNPRSVEPTPQRATPDEFYFENGLMIFKASYHLRRGHCCGSGCRHCPY